jgi:hypothetical protein
MKRDLDVARAVADSISPEALERLVHYSEPDPPEPHYGRLTEMFRAALCGPHPPKGEPNE